MSSDCETGLTFDSGFRGDSKMTSGFSPSTVLMP